MSPLSTWASRRAPLPCLSPITYRYPSRSAAWYDAPGRPPPVVELRVERGVLRQGRPPPSPLLLPPQTPQGPSGIDRRAPCCPPPPLPLQLADTTRSTRRSRRPTHMKRTATEPHCCVPAGGGCAAMWWLVHVSRAGGQGLHQGLLHLSLTPTGTAQKGLWTVAGRPHNHTAAVRRGAEHPTRQHAAPSI